MVSAERTCTFTSPRRARPTKRALLELPRHIYPDETKLPLFMAISGTSPGLSPQDKGFQRRRLIGPQGVGSRNLADPVPDNRGRGPGRTKCRRRSGRVFAAIRFHGRQNALASWVAAILRIWGTLLVPFVFGSTVARNSILAEVDKICKREKIILRRSKEQGYNPYPVCHTRTNAPPRVRRHGTAYPPPSCHAST